MTKDQAETLIPAEDDCPVLQHGAPVRMSIACSCCCVVGIILMAALGLYPLMWTFVGILACTLLGAFLLWAGKIDTEAACLAPMILLCFVYTPLSWFAFDGLLGCTPYLTILYTALIVFTYYRKIQAVMLSLYGALIAGLIVHWLAAHAGDGNIVQIINILVAYILTISLCAFIAESLKRKNHEITRRVADLSVRDDLTGLLNRRVSEQIMGRVERAFREESADYAVVMIDVDDFKNINDLYGHNLGDSALKSLAACIQDSIRSTDYAFRIGGDEFLLVLPHVGAQGALQICARVKAAARDLQGFAFPILVSTGLALRSESTDSAALFELADRRMYDAKRARGAAPMPDA